VQPSLSIIIPAYNEEARIGSTLRAMLRYLDKFDNIEVIVVDDGSTDRTNAVVRAALVESRGPCQLIRYDENRGKGYAVRVGLLSASAPIAVFSDADLSTPISELSKVVDPIRGGECDIAFGSRALDRRLIGEHQPLFREWGGRVFNFVLRAATALPFKDTQCGFKAFRMSCCRPILEAATIDRFGFDVELLYVAYRLGLRLKEVPVRWNHCDGSKVSMARDSPHMLADVLTVRRRAAGTFANVVHTQAEAHVRA
jgi:glycosyltransferase involved in cell wall biosynthesis